MAVKEILILVVFCAYTCNAACPNIVGLPVLKRMEITGFATRLPENFTYFADNATLSIIFRLQVAPHRILQSVWLSGTYIHYRVFIVSADDLQDPQVLPANSSNYLRNTTGRNWFYPSTNSNRFDRYIGGPRDILFIRAYAPYPKRPFYATCVEIRICVQPQVGIDVERDNYKCNPDEDFTLNMTCYLTNVTDTASNGTVFNVDTGGEAVAEYQEMIREPSGTNRYRYILSNITVPTLNVTCDLKDPPSGEPERKSATVNIHDLFAPVPQMTANGHHIRYGDLSTVMAGSDLRIRCDIVGDHHPLAITGIFCTGFRAVESSGNHTEALFEDLTSDDDDTLCRCEHKNICHRVYTFMLINVSGTTTKTTTEPTTTCKNAATPTGYATVFSAAIWMHCACLVFQILKL